MKFEEMFSEVQSFTDGSFVVSGYIPKQTAFEMIIAEDFPGWEFITIDDIEIDYVRFGFPSSDVEGDFDCHVPIWTGCANKNKKGSKRIWCYNP